MYDGDDSKYGKVEWSARQKDMENCRFMVHSKFSDWR